MNNGVVFAPSLCVSADALTSKVATRIAVMENIGLRYDTAQSEVVAVRLACKSYFYLLYAACSSNQSSAYNFSASIEFVHGSSSASWPHAASLAWTMH